MWVPPCLLLPVSSCYNAKFMDNSCHTYLTPINGKDILVILFYVIFKRIPINGE